MSDIWPYPPWVAHRGAGALAPENTLAAFKLDASCGYGVFECDVKLSSNSMSFLLYYNMLERTTNSADAAGLQTWQTLRKFDAGSWHSATYASKQIHSLDCTVKGVAKRAKLSS